MRETLLKLDDINKELKNALTLKEEKAHIDKVWLNVFDTLIIDIIETRKIIDFACADKKVDWEFVLKAIKKDLPP